MDEISDVLHEIERLVHEMVCLGKTPMRKRRICTNIEATSRARNT